MFAIRPSINACLVILSAALGVAPYAGRAGADPTPALPEDPFTWLEELDGARALDWVRAESAKTVAAIERDSRYAGLYQDALAIAEAKDRIPEPQFLGGRILNQWQDAGHVHGIWRATSLADYRRQEPRWQTVLDLDDLAKTEHANWFMSGAECEEPAERRCMIHLSDSGEDAITPREFDLRTGGFVQGGFSLPRGKQDLAWEEEDTLLVAREWAPGELTSSGYPFIVKRLKRGQALAAAKEVFRGTAEDVEVAPFALQDGAGHRAVVIQRNVSYFEAEYRLLNHGTLVKLALPPKVDLQALVANRLVISLRDDWKTDGGPSFAQGSVVAVDLSRARADPQHLRPELVYAPGPREAFQRASATRSHLLVTTLDNVKGRAYVYTPQARGPWPRRRLALPDNATIDIVDADLHGERAFLTVTGFLTPSSLWLADLNGATAVMVRALPAQFDASKHVVEQLEATAKDGTRIPYFLVRPRAMQGDGGTPTVLSAYGGFQIAETPSYSGNIGKLWLERGGAYALANIRGGGEFGPAWHEAGLKTHRQVIFDDFYAVAQDLIARGITSSSRLGISGGSNGGLLMGVELTQHPESWAAVDIEVPLLDMLGYENIAAGSSWVGEYGSIANPEERAFLASISPYNNLRPGVRYPEALIWTNSRDDRVGPQHARKFAAKLASIGAPYLFYEPIEGGHSAGATLAERAAMRAREYVYFARRLMGP